MAALQFLAKYRETGLLLFRASIGLIFIILDRAGPVERQGSWEHFGSGHETSGLSCPLQILGISRRAPRLRRRRPYDPWIIFSDRCALRSGRHAGSSRRLVGQAAHFYARLPALEMSILLLSLLFVGPGKYSVDKN